MPDTLKGPTEFEPPKILTCSPWQNVLTFLSTLGGRKFRLRHRKHWAELAPMTDVVLLRLGAGERKRAPNSHTQPEGYAWA